MSDVAFKPAKHLAGKIRRREISCLDLLDHYLARVEKHNPTLNAIVVTDIPSHRPDTGRSAGVGIVYNN